MADNTSIVDIAKLNELVIPNMNQLELIPTLFNFLICVVMSFIVRDFYIRRSFSLTGKMHIGSIIPVLSLVVFLVIAVVKSSLALSLGLVGALSIVRFRTPIKEPEDLVYLFLAIAVGLGYAAGHTLITTIITLLILAVVYLWLSNRKVSNTSEYNLVVNWKDKAITLDSILHEIKSVSQNMKLIRIDRGAVDSTAVALIIPEENISIDSIIKGLSELDDEMNITFFEAKTNW
jgi:hypothetical protein